MHGLLFVTWERYIAERFGNALLSTYRTAIGETLATIPLATHVYSDHLFLSNIQTLSQLTSFSTNTLLQEYGRYFIINGLTGYLCTHLLSQVHSGKELLLIMRDAHAQLRQTPDGLTPPLFMYEYFITRPEDLLLIYDSPRHLCPLLIGAIEGAAERYGERAIIKERTCMRNGAPTCRIAISFHATTQAAPKTRYETAEHIQKRRERQRLTQLILAQLPLQEGITLTDIHQKLQKSLLKPELLRPFMLFETLRHLQYAGLIASSANQPGDEIIHRRYWKVPPPPKKDPLIRKKKTLDIV